MIGRSELERRIAAVLRSRGLAEEPPDCVVTCVGALPRRRLHEWLGVAPSHDAPADASAGPVAAPPAEDVSAGAVCGRAASPPRQPWAPPLCLLADLVAQALRRTPGQVAIWVGRDVWPYPSVLRGAGRHGLFIDPRSVAERVWALETVLPSPAVAAIVADGSGFDLTATRRLQLAAEASPGALLLLARPPRERAERSAAACRWWVQAAPSPAFAPRWQVTRLRCKDAMNWQGGQGEQRCYCLEWRHEQGLVAAPAGMVDRSLAAAQQSA